MDTKTRSELLAICKTRGIKGFHRKKKAEILEILRVPSVHAAPLQDTGLFRTSSKEQFYTKTHVATLCIERILTRFPAMCDYVWVEPSAGNGAFLDQFPSSAEKIGLDIDPRASDIQQQDYLTWTPHTYQKPVIVCGNPPFGRQSSLAKAFILKSCAYASVIAFILPKSFTKPSMFNVFHRTFHLVDSLELEKHSFLIGGGEPYDVPCVFQIWQKQATVRAVEPKVSPVGFQYVSSTDAYHMVCRRVGGSAGTCHAHTDASYNPQSHYFILLDESHVASLSDIITKMNAHTFPSNTVGPRSLSKSEINQELNAILLMQPLPLSS